MALYDLLQFYLLFMRLIIALPRQAKYVCFVNTEYYENVREPSPREFDPVFLNSEHIIMLMVQWSFFLKTYFNIVEILQFTCQMIGFCLYLVLSSKLFFLNFDYFGIYDQNTKKSKFLTNFRTTWNCHIVLRSVLSYYFKNFIWLRQFLRVLKNYEIFEFVKFCSFIPFYWQFKVLQKSKRKTQNFLLMLWESRFFLSSIRMGIMECLIY